jgi:hypothetical protein
LEPVREGDEFEKTVKTYEKAKHKYLHYASHRGEPANNFLLSVRELNTEARSHYKKTMTEIGNNIYPLIIAHDVDPEDGLSGLGGTYTIYFKDGSSNTVRPTSEEYEIRKALSHIPIGLFSIVAPYFRSPGGPGMKGPFQSFYSKVLETAEAASLVSESIHRTELQYDGMKILNITMAHMNLWARKGSVSPGAFEKYSGELFPHIEVNIQKCARLQVNAVYPALEKWKNELGDTEWKKVHALIPTIWPVSAINPRLQILSKLMDPEQVRNQVFIVENGGSSIKSLKGILGKIIGDRAAGLLILGTKTKAQKELTFNLSGRQDLISIASADALSELTSEEL